MAAKRALWKQVVRGIARGLLLCVLLAGALALFAYVSVKVVFTPENVRFLLMDQVTNAFGGRPVLMQSVSVDPFQGIRVEGFKVLHRGETWTEPLIESDKLVARFELWPLLRDRRLVIDQILLVNPKVRVARYPDGTFDFQDLLLRPRGGGLGLGPVALSVAEARVSNGTFIWDDRLTGQHYSLDQIQLRAKGFRLSGEFPVQLSFVTDSRWHDLNALGTVDAAGSLNVAGFDWGRAQADISELHLRTPDWRLSARGYVSDFRHPQGAVDATLSPSAGGVELRIKNLSELMLPHLSAQASFAFPEPGRLEVRAFQVQSRGSSVSGDARLQWVAPASWSVHVKSDGVRLNELSDYWRQLAPYALQGVLGFETTVSSGPSGLSLGHTTISLDGGAGVWRDDRLRRADLVLAAAPDFKSARLQVQRLDALYFGQTISGLSADALIQGQDWTFRRLHGVWNGMTWDLSGKVTRLLSPKSVEVHGGVDVLKVQEVVNLVKRLQDYLDRRRKRPATPRERKWFEYVKYGVPKNFPALSGRLSAKRVVYDYITARDFAIRFKVGGWGSGMKNLDGYAQYTAGPGRLINIPAMMADSRFLDVVFLPFRTLEKINSMGILHGWKPPRDLDYRRIVGSYKATWGNVRINEFLIDTSDISMSADGQLDLPVETMQLHVLNHLTHYRGIPPETLSCDDGLPCLSFNCDGDLGMPDCHLDLDKVRSQKGADVLRKRLNEFKILKTIIPED